MLVSQDLPQHGKSGSSLSLWDKAADSRSRSVQGDLTQLPVPV